MKDRIYLRVAKDGGKFKSAASSKPLKEPLFKGSGHNKRYLPTVLIALDMKIADREFDDARIELNISIDRAEPAIEVRQVEPNGTEEHYMDREVQT